MEKLRCQKSEYITREFYLLASILLRVQSSVYRSEVLSLVRNSDKYMKPFTLAFATKLLVLIKFLDIFADK